MSLWKRAALYVARRKGRTVLLFLILFIIITLVLTGISIGNATDEAAAVLRRNLGGYFKVEVDYEKPAAGQPVDGSLISAIEGIGGVEEGSGLNIYYLAADGLALSPGRFAGMGDGRAQITRFLANTDSALSEYFMTETFELAEGRYIRPGEKRKAIISDTLAQANGLAPGDMIEAGITQDVQGAPEGSVGETFDLEVVGIFHTNVVPPYGIMTPESDIADNFIFTDEDTGFAAMEAMGMRPGRYVYGATFTVEDPKDIDAIVGQAEALPGVNWEALKVTVNDKAYQTSAEPLSRLSGYTGMLVWIILIVGVALLSLILTLWMRDRVHEMGIYLSIGIAKIGIIGQFLAECMMIAALAFCLSWFASGGVANLAANAVLENLTVQEAPAQSAESAYFNDPVGLSSEAQTPAEIDVNVGPGEFWTVVALGTIIIFASVGLSSILVVRMKPKDILSSAG